MLLGYARVSTSDQTLHSQEDDLRAAGCERIFTDVASGSKAARPGLHEALAHLRKVTRWSSGGSTGSDVLSNTSSRRSGQLEATGRGFRSLRERLDATTPGGKLVFHLFGALAEFERGVIRERTNAGLASARARGRVGGRPRSLDKETGGNGQSHAQGAERAGGGGRPHPGGVAGNDLPGSAANPGENSLTGVSVPLLPAALD